MELVSKTNILGLKSCLWPNNGHAKTANLIMEYHLEGVPDVTNKQYHSKELNQGFSMLFFVPSALPWSLRKLGLKMSLISLLGTI